MFDGDVEAQDEFEKSVTTSMQKALSALWCSYKFPFRLKELTLETESGVSSYKKPHGNISQFIVDRSRVYGVRIGGTYLNLEKNYRTLEEKSGKPTSFYIKNISSKEIRLKKIACIYQHWYAIIKIISKLLQVYQTQNPK